MPGLMGYKQQAQGQTQTTSARTNTKNKYMDKHEQQTRTTNTNKYTNKHEQQQQQRFADVHVLGVLQQQQMCSFTNMDVLVVQTQKEHVFHI